LNISHLVIVLRSMDTIRPIEDTTAIIRKETPKKDVGSIMSKKKDMNEEITGNILSPHSPAVI